MDSFTKGEQVSKSHSVFAYAVLLLLIVLGTVERIYGIDRQSLWSDELYAVTASYFDTYADVWKLMLGDSHPPGYLTFMYFTLPFTGYTDFGIRLHALLFGIAWIPLVFYLGKRWFSIYTGLMAAAMLASGYNAVYFSQEARAYTMLVTFCLLNAICFLEILLAGSKLKRHRWGVILSSAAMLYLHYTGFVLVCTQILFYCALWVTRQRRGSVREALLLFGVPFLFYAPWLEVMYNNLMHEPRDWSVSEKPTVAEFFNTMQRLFGPDRQRTQFHVISIAVVLLGVVIANVRHGLSRKVILMYFLLFFASVPIVVFLVKSLISTPIFEKRYFMTALPFFSIMMAAGFDFAIQKIPGKWKALVVTSVIVLLSIWFVRTNMEMRLYSLLDKDPVREAVNEISHDLGQKKSEKNYTIIMTHDWFEHYLRRSGIAFDKNWKYRHYYVAQEVDKVDTYLSTHPEIEYFYYLSLREPNAVAALVPLKQTYKLLKKNEVSIEQGTIDIFKFSAREKPDEKQLSEVGSNPSNEIARKVAAALRDKHHASYRVLWTHDWIRPYLEKNGVHIDEQQGDGSYVVDVQVDSIVDYLKAHQEVDTLYYLALREPNAEAAAFMLQSRYQLESEQSVRVAVGNMNILRFNVKAPPKLTPALQARMAASPTHQAIAPLATVFKEQSALHALVLATHKVFDPYVEQYGAAVDRSWGGDAYYLASEQDKLLAYLQAHPEKTTLYYLAVVEPNVQPAIDWLRGRYRQGCEQSTELAIGRISLMRFDINMPPAKDGSTPPLCRE